MLHPKNNQQNLTIQGQQNSMSIKQMIQYILKQISDINQTDINVMKPDEIIGIYNQLVNENTMVIQQLNTRNQQNVNIDQGGESNPNNFGDCNISKDSQPVNLKSVQQHKSKEIHCNNKVKINSSYYFIPQCLKRESYNIANKRYQIICHSKPSTIEQKRRLVLQSFSPSMNAVIKSLNDKQIEETYQNLQTINRSQLYLSVQQKQHKLPQIRQFIIYTKNEQINQEQIKSIRNKEEMQKILQQQNKQIIQQEKQKQYISNFFHINNSFFNQSTNKYLPTNHILSTNNQKYNQQSIKQTIQSAKNKNTVQNYVQTDQQINTNKPTTKTKLTVLSQVQYINDNDESSHIQTTYKPQNIDSNDQIIIDATPQKMRSNNIVHALIHPKDMPDPQIIKWIKSMKNLLIKFEYEYLNQFKSNWIIIND